MSKSTRRQFLEESMIAAGVAAAMHARAPVARSEESKRVGPNDTLRHAVIGCRIRGRVHASEFARLAGVEVAYVCDPDSQLREELATAVETQTGKRPQAVADLRTVFDDQSVDTVSIAAPNHWHALAAIWAMQSGKDVYVEKPVSHNVSEGRRIVQVARKLGRICQAGTQNRSRGDLAEAAKFIHSGQLGDVDLARTIVYGRRNSIGPRAKIEFPQHIDANLWLGPGANQAITRPNVHYDWHWVWDTGSGELGNNSIHYVDICRWLLGLKGLGETVVSVGARVGYQDAGETPNTQLVVHRFGSPNGSDVAPSKQGVTVIQEVRGLKSDPYSKKFKAGHIIHGSEGFIAEGTLFDPDGNLVKTFQGPNANHFENFVQAVRSRRKEDLHADILEGHQSSALCHLGNISYRLGEVASTPDIEARLNQQDGHPEVTQSFRNMTRHLKDNGIQLKDTPLTMGPLLKLGANQEEFSNHDVANAMLRREYRRPFAVPSEAEIL